METIEIDGEAYRGVNLPTEHSALLVIQGARGFIGCGYIKIETADKLNEAVALVTKVRSYDDMLNTPVIAVSEKARAIGIEVGVQGSEALKLLGGIQE
jgi:uncharacterized protein YunC (DUF1805 family)